VAEPRIPEYAVTVLNSGVVGPRQGDGLIVNRRRDEIGRSRWRCRAVRVRRTGVAFAVEGDHLIADLLLGREPLIVEVRIVGPSRADRFPWTGAARPTLDAEPLLVGRVVRPIHGHTAARRRIHVKS